MVKRTNEQSELIHDIWVECKLLTYLHITQEIQCVSRQLQKLRWESSTLRLKNFTYAESVLKYPTQKQNGRP